MIQTREDGKSKMRLSQPWSVTKAESRASQMASTPLVFVLENPSALITKKESRNRNEIHRVWARRGDG